MQVIPDHATCYRAVSGRDRRFDGWIYVGVTSTGIYCRPSCPAQTPQQANCSFFAAAGAAQQAGFRACRRCHPDAVPGSPQWNLRADTVGRAMRLITDGVVDRIGVAGLAAELGYSERQLNRLLMAEVGASPLALARAQRAHAARLLIESSTLPMGDVAFAAGFSSIRQFNDTVRAVFGRPPTSLRGRTRTEPQTPGLLRLRLPVREPFNAKALFTFLGCRAVRGVERFATTNGRLSYSRTIMLPHGAAVIRLEWSQSDGLVAMLLLADLRDLGRAVSRVRRLCDLDADPVAIDEALSASKQLRQLVQDAPGLRLPGTPDPHELAFRALIGQQISVAGAATCAAKIVAEHGARVLLADDADLVALFPSAAELAALDPAGLPMPKARGRAITGLAAALAEGRIDLSPGSDRTKARADLLELPGIGGWTADYIVMRGLGHPDVSLDTDLIIKRELARRGIDNTGSFSPWRSYATLHLWKASS